MEHFSFFKSYYEAADELSDEQFGKYVRALCQYAFFEQEAEVKGVVKALYKMAIPIINKQRNMPKGGRSQKFGEEVANEIVEKYKAGASQTQLAEQYGCSQKTISNVIAASNSSKNSVNTSNLLVKTDRIGKDRIGEEKEEDRSNISAPKRKQFVPPTLEQVKDYCKYGRKNGWTDDDCKHFVDYFTEMNWVDSEGKPVQSWKGKLITWETMGHRKGDTNKRPIRQNWADRTLMVSDEEDSEIPF